MLFLTRLTLLCCRCSLADEKLEDKHEMFELCLLFVDGGAGLFIKWHATTVVQWHTELIKRILDLSDLLPSPV